jgi:RNase H-like domain found in reverse transcriptase
VLLKKNSFLWGSDAETTFETLKHAMCKAPVLAMSDFHQPFTLEIGVSATGTGTVLM